MNSKMSQFLCIFDTRESGIFTRNDVLRHVLMQNIDDLTVISALKCAFCKETLSRFDELRMRFHDIS